MLVHGTVEVFLGALDLDVRLDRPPAATDRALVSAGHLLNDRQETDR
jgi:hypothetical protein